MHRMHTYTLSSNLVILLSRCMLKLITIVSTEHSQMLPSHHTRKTYSFSHDLFVDMMKHHL